MVPTTSPGRSARTASPARLAPLLAALVVLVLSGCHDLLTEPRGEISFQSVVKATVTGRSGPQIREVVRDEGRWAAVWRELWGGSAPPRPDLDFRREIAVVATASLSCFGDVEIEGVERLGSGVLVRMGDGGPPPLCVCGAPEYVFHVVRAPRVEGPVSFDVRQIPHRCR